jgi:hypothetical protein
MQQKQQILIFFIFGPSPSLRIDSSIAPSLRLLLQVIEIIVLLDRCSRHEQADKFLNFIRNQNKTFNFYRPRIK